MQNATIQEEKPTVVPSSSPTISTNPPTPVTVDPPPLPSAWPIGDLSDDPRPGVSQQLFEVYGGTIHQSMGTHLT